MCIEWLFFDVGNTLVDESKAYETRLREAAALVGKPYDSERSSGFLQTKR